MLQKVKKAAKYVIMGGVALFVKQLWDPILAPFTRPITAVLSRASLSTAMRLGIAVV